MNKQDFTKIEELLEKIYKTLIYVFLIVGFFAFLYFRAYESDLLAVSILKTQPTIAP